MKHSFKTILFLFALVSLVKSHDVHTCNHHKHQAANPPKLLDVEEDFSSLEPGRILASTTYPQIRIHANYDILASQTNASYTSYVRDLLAPAVISYFQSALKVKYPVVGNLKLPSTVTTLCGLSTPSELKTGVAADYAIIFNSHEENTTVVATSKYCYLASGTRRPLVANTNFNTKMFLEANGDVLLHEKNTYLLLHEMTHTFGFSASCYQYFLNASGSVLTGHVKSMKIAGATHTVLDIPALTTRVRNFHGCSTLPGVILENDGGSGTDDSHLEKTYYVYESMSSGSQSGKRISQISLGVLEASGWYVVNYTYAEPYFYGQGEGCNFINGICSANTTAFDEFCTGTARGCAFMGQSGGTCMLDSKMDGCRYVNPINTYHCENSTASRNARLPTVEVYARGAGSKCFTGTLNTKATTSSTSFCFKFNCTGTGVNTKLTVILGNKTAICTKEGTATVQGYYGTIDCPDPLKFCSTVGKQYCPRSCMARGKCVNNKCVCNTGFTGVDCALKV